MFKRIAHVCLHVRDLQRSVDFYAKLGLRTKFQFTRGGAPFGVYLEIADSSYVEIFEDKNRGPVENTGIGHFCLETEDVDALSDHLRARGIPFTDKKLGCDGTYQIWLKDPDGNSFEVHQYTPASTQKTGGTVEADW
jgi:lactoylglutathione lyase